MWGRLGQERGSIILFTLFVCLGVAVLVQTVSVVVLCANQSFLAEDAGRDWMAESDEALAQLRELSLVQWGPMPWSTLREMPQGVEVSAEALANSDNWALAAAVRHAPALTPTVVSAWIERGRDGLDLPVAGLVAATAVCAPDRVSAWMEIDASAVVGGAGPRAVAGGTAHLQSVPVAPLLGPGVTLVGMANAWNLDDGWRAFFETGQVAGSGGRTGEVRSALPGVATTEDVYTVSGDPGTTIQLPTGWGEAVDRPALLVATGGARLDARNRGELYGVIVIDGGGALLDGSKLHGALFATGAADFGASGAVVYTPSILRWATDGSLFRTRLVPGSRGETAG